MDIAGILGLGIFLYILYLIVKVLVKLTSSSSTKPRETESKQEKLYYYSRKPQFITTREKEFFSLLQATAGDKYLIFPQIHLASIFKNETIGYYHKLAFSIINQRSVDYVLCDKQTFEVVYAVELDDSTHDTIARIKRDTEVNELFAEHGIPLVRFRDYRNLSTEDVAKRFYEASHPVLQSLPS
jgi:hypothetical protein